ncbi:PREDICTED: arrestin domain-containing protein 2-like [Ceratosolen solmsi marchali]|uniref:Arrestin domain-containing protein 2-like n=1 Tax=Ceratosolen solmsi marchali TaxID=326594 RepID=A0AAJ7DXQ5_9HYME|nr:PREDICTED: arrestin domain-containing protein 2-like [Ceratosolen solmsi marchali]
MAQVLQGDPQSRVVMMRSQEETAYAPDPACHGLERIDISLDNEDRVFMGGQILTGKVILELAAPIEALGIRLRCRSDARVYFTDRSIGIRRKFSAEESYFLLEPYLVGDGKSKSQLTNGIYPFSMELPEKTPCSFEGLYGRIRYSIRAILLMSKDIVFSTNALPFTLASFCDLNQDSLAPLPISENQSKIFIGQKEPLTISLSLPVRGFVPGQTVPMEITLKNESHIRIAKIRIVLKKVVTYNAKEKSRRHKEIIVEIALPVSSKEEIYKENFDVPSIPPSRMEFCNIIDVRYALKVEACIDLNEWYYRLLQKNLKIRTTIFIGTIPLKNYEDAINENVNASSELNINENRYVKSQIYRSSKPEKDDPTGDEEECDGENSPFSPMYRVYAFKKLSKK